MPLLAVLSREPTLQTSVERAAGMSYRFAGSSSWANHLRLIRERPVTGSVLDLDSLIDDWAPEEALSDLRSRFPNLGLIVLLRRRPNPTRLFRLGRAGIQNLILLDGEDLSRAIPVALQRAAERSATAMVTRVMSPHLPFRELNALRVAMDGIDYRWSAERFAEMVGLSRPFLSERLKACRLPSTGHLLLWTRLIHAGMWLEEPGRTGESVSRQLEYSSGAAFRRALKMYTGATPTEVVEEGGVSFVLGRFLQACGLSRAASQLSAG